MKVGGKCEISSSTAKNMHGVDWQGVYEKYKVLIPLSITGQTSLMSSEK